MTPGPTAAGRASPSAPVARVLLGAVLAGAVLAGGAGRPAAATTSPSPSGILLDGHGWGHGVGMGQWGALGYALDGQGYTTMLGHYYGGTGAGTLPAGNIRVRIVENDGNDIDVTSGSPFTVAGVSFAAGQAALMHLTSTPGTWAVSQGPGCAGPWTQVATATDSGSTPTAVATPSVDTPAATSSQVLHLCLPSAGMDLRGSIQAAEIDGLARTVNVLPMEQYLRSVVPSESPAGWGQLGGSGAQGQHQGFQALEAQAVAARSYAAAAEAAPSSQGGTGTYGYADICDTPACQVYSGMGAENPASDLAVADTAGQVRVDGSGRVVSTPFSSSTGGWTAGGPFPAVVDDGDSVCVPGGCNPNHDWSMTIPAATLESAYPSIGTFRSLQVTGRAGPVQAADGGRVTAVVVNGSAGSVQATGAGLAGVLGLRSDWFSVVGTPSGGLDGYWLGAADGGVFSFGAAAFHGSTGAMKLNSPVVAMTGTPSGNGYWLVAGDGGIFTFGDARFFGSTGNIRLNQPVVGMAPTADGGGYWLVARDGGIFTFGDARFFGSTGNIRLNQPVVGMAPTADGGGYWMVAADGGVFNFGDATFHGSGAATQGAPATTMAAGPGGGGYWILRSDGTVLAFGSAGALGSVSGLAPGDAAAGLAPTASGNGYLVTSRRGIVFSFGDAPQYGGMPDQVPGYPGRILSIVGRPGS